MKEKILVCGAGGFIGHHMVRYLKKKGYWVRGVDIKYPEYSSVEEADEFFPLDLREFHNCLIATEGIDKVYQFAADMGGMYFIMNNKSLVMRDSALINIHMAEACKVNKIKRIFYSSSACIYPEFKQTDIDVVPLKESDAYPAQPDTEYGWEKLFSERIYKAYESDHGLEVRIARYHNVYGPEGTYTGGRQKAPADFSRQVALAGPDDKITLIGDGKQTRSFMYVDDCIEGTYRLMESNHNEPLNIGSDYLISMNDLVDMVSKIAGKKLAKAYNEGGPQGVRGRNADLTLCKKILKWEPQMSLENGMEVTYKWIEKQVKKDLLEERSMKMYELIEKEFTNNGTNKEKKGLKAYA